ncbi:MAG: hypothetical protein DI632_00035 [Sphingomonas hengshuiensis]|uniref:Uncharacterized protein n=1 Tax=Sphingomonas hengshuiensis TaxID=1609977 RepID=A0A2W4ZH78_9SPHN|nr:MAG: hypothetical protein DI632_00035 [Sphingomonas hengshuiensis]
MSGKQDAPRAIAEAMLGIVDPASVTVSAGEDRFAVTIAGVTITFGVAAQRAFERLASAIEAQVAYQRATAMVVAADETGAPLWLVAAPDMLGKWLSWSRTDKALSKVLTLTNRAGAAPVIGDLARRARRDLGQMSAKIRVRCGQAVAERIELSHRVPAVATLSERATIRVARHHLPDTLVLGLKKDATSNDRWRASEIVGHPFFATHDFMVAEVRNDGDDIVIVLETFWESLQPIPKAAWTAVPRDADPTFPWRPTRREITELYGLAARGERMIQGHG